MARLTWEQLEKVKEKYNCDRLYSWSRVHCFQVSPFEYLLKYILKAKEDRLDCIYTSTGGLAHDIIERFYTGQIKYEDMINEFEDGWMVSRDISQLKFDRNDEEHDQKLADRYYENLQHFFKNHIVLKHKPALEKFVVAKIGDSVLNGYIDCCFKDDDGCYNIVDWKTSSIYKGKKAEGECGQLVVYAIALNQLGVSFDNIKICWDFLKYCSVQYEQANGAVKSREIERCKLGESLQTNAKMWLKKLGYENEVGDYLKLLLDTNSIDALPEDVRDKYVVSDCFVYVPLTQKLIDKWTNEIITTIKDIEAREKDYAETKNMNVFWDTPENVKAQSYYFSTLMAYSPNKHLPYKQYLDDLEKQKQGMDFFSGVGSDTTESTPVNDDMSWLNEIL